MLSRFQFKKLDSNQKVWFNPLFAPEFNLEPEDHIMMLQLFETLTLLFIFLNIDKEITIQMVVNFQICKRIKCQGLKQLMWHLRSKLNPGADKC